MTFTLGAYPLPVVLTACTAQAIQNRDALLNWATVSGQNSASFEVARSLDGSSFTKIGQAAAQGTSASATAYTSTDAGIGARAQGSVYYCLRQFYLNGAAFYSPVRTVSCSCASKASITGRAAWSRLLTLLAHELESSRYWPPPQASASP